MPRIVASRPSRPPRRLVRLLLSSLRRAAPMPRLCDTDVAQAMATTTTATLLVYLVIAINASVFEMKMHEMHKRKVVRDHAHQIRLPALVLRVIGHVVCLYVMPCWFIAVLYTSLVFASFF